MDVLISSLNFAIHGCLHSYITYVSYFSPSFYHSFQLLQYLSAGNVPATLPMPLDLTYLSLSINMHSLEEVLACLCLLRSSPNLEDVKFLMLVKFFSVSHDCIGYLLVMSQQEIFNAG